MKKILITPRSLTAKSDPALNRLKDAGYDVILGPAGRQPEEIELLELVPGCQGWLAGVEKITENVLVAADELKVISRNGVGVDNIDLDAARRRGIQIRRTPQANSRGVAELTIGLLIDLARSISYSDGVMKGGDWKRRKGIELCGRTLGIIGCGAVGRIVAELACAMGLSVLAHDIAPDDCFSPSDCFRYASLDDLLAQSDFLTLHMPAAPGGRPIIDRVAVGKMKKGVRIVNTARAGLADESALLEGLESERIAGLATDVFAKEPPEITPLYAHDRVILTPHIGGFTDESVWRSTTGAVQNILDVLEGKTVGPENLSCG